MNDGCKNIIYTFVVKKLKFIHSAWTPKNTHFSSGKFCPAKPATLKDTNKDITWNKRHWLL